GPGSHLRLIEPPKAADRERDTALCLRLSLHDGVSEGVALEPGDAHGSDCLVCAPLRITSACRDDVDIVAVHLAPGDLHADAVDLAELDRKSTRLNSSHVKISYAVFCLKKKKKAT